jgi:hypothetical protein
VRAKGKFTFSAAVPHNWDRDDLKIDGKPLIEHAQDILDYVSVMAYRGRNIEKVSSRSSTSAGTSRDAWS